MKRQAGRVTASAIFLTAILGLWPTPAPAQEGDGEGQWPPPEELVWFAQSLTGEDQAIQEARAALLDHIQETYLATPGDTRTISLRTWNDLTGVLADDMALQVRGQWVSALRSAYVEDAQAFTAMDLSAAERLSTALSRLDDQRAREVVPAWMAQSASWQELEPGGLVALARRLQWCGAAGAPARAELGGFLTSRYVTDAESLGTVPLGDVLRLANLLALDLSPEARTQWVTGLHTAVLQHGEAGGTLGTYTTTWLKDALTAMGEENPTQTVLAWVQAAEWAAMGPDGLARLAHHLAQIGEAGKEGRLEMAEHLQTCYLADAASVRKLSPQHWEWLTGHLAEDLSAETRALWTQRLLEAYVEDASTLETVEAPSLANLTMALDTLGAGVSSQVTLQWMDAVDWRQCEPSDLVHVARRLANVATGGGAAREALTQHVRDTYLSNIEAAKSIGLRCWRDFARVLNVSMEVRRAWAEWLEQEYSQVAGLAGLAPGDLDTLCQLLNDVGSAEGPYMVARYVTGVPAWRDQQRPNDVTLLLRLMRGAVGEDVSEARQAIIGHLETDYLNGAQATQRMSLSQWRDVAQLLTSYLAPETRESWCTAIRGGFAGDRAAALLLEPEEVNALVDCMAALDESQASELGVLWLTEKMPSAKEKPLALARLAHTTAKKEPGAMAPLMAELEGMWLASAAVAAGDLRVIDAIAWTYSAMGAYEKDREWIMRAYAAAVGTEEARSGVTIQELHRLAIMLEEHALLGPEWNHKAFAMALSRLAQTGDLVSGRHEVLAFPLGAAEARQTLATVLLDSDGNPRLGVAKILAWAHRTAGEFALWRTLADEKITASSGDPKAFWLAVRGYTDALVPTRPDPSRRLAWLKKALQVAQTDGAKIRLLEEIGEFYSQIERPKLAVELIDSVRGQFGGEAAQAVDRLHTQFSRVAARRDLQRERAKARARVSRREAKLAYCRERLNQARERGDTEAVARLEAAIRQLEDTLGD
jgi:hypothetical protein